MWFMKKKCCYRQKFMCMRMIKNTRIYRSKWRTYRRYFCFRRNAIAMNFYQREGLEIQREDFDQATGEKEYVMIWSQK